MKAVVAIILAVVIVGAIFGVVTLVFMALWNAVMPSVFGLAVLTFWQSFAILVLLNLVGSALGLRYRHTSK